MIDIDFIVHNMTVFGMCANVQVEQLVNSSLQLGYAFLRMS